MNASDVASRALRGVSDLLRAGQNALGDAERVTRFMRGRMEFEPRVTDIFVATYPRSGTTWIQFILYLLTSDRKMDFDHIGQVSPWYERTLALGTREAADFESLPNPRVFKTHLTPEWLPDGVRVIYSERDVHDVAVSYFHLYRSHLNYRGSFEQFVDRFLRGRVQYRSWFDHVSRWRRWAEAHPNRVLSLQYEAMRRDLSSAVTAISEFAGIARTQDLLSEVVRMADFDFMRAHQSLFDPVTETLLDSGLVKNTFIRAGQTGEGQRVLTDEQKQQVEATRRAWRAPTAGEWRIHDFLH